jgi:hypothetical protein
MIKLTVCRAQGPSGKLIGGSSTFQIAIKAIAAGVHRFGPCADYKCLTLHSIANLFSVDDWTHFGQRRIGSNVSRMTWQFDHVALVPVGVVQNI